MMWQVLESVTKYTQKDVKDTEKKYRGHDLIALNDGYSLN